MSPMSKEKGEFYQVRSGSVFILIGRIRFIFLSKALSMLEDWIRIYEKSATLEKNTDFFSDWLWQWLAIELLD